MFILFLFDLTDKTPRYTMYLGESGGAVGLIAEEINVLGIKFLVKKLMNIAPLKKGT